MHLFFAVHSNSNERRIFHEKNCNSIDTPQDTLKYFSIIVPSVMKGVAKESDAKEGGKKNAKRLEHGHVIWPFLLHAPYLHSVSNQTAKVPCKSSSFSHRINGLVSTYLTRSLCHQY